MPANSSALTRALDTVDEDAFVLRPDGNLISQTSAREVIAELIERLDLRPG